jgi:hypothetical protein
MAIQLAPAFVAAEFRLLLDCFAALTDARHARGKIHPLPAALALTVVGLMAGQTSLKGIAQWSRHEPRTWRDLGLRRSPSVATLWRLTQLVSVAEVCAALLQFTAALHAGRTPADAAPTAVALDGKTHRGTQAGAAQLHVLHAFAGASGLVLAQVPLPSHAQEPATARAWLAQFTAAFPAFEILTGDALYADQSLCAAIVAAGKQYVVKVKKTGPSC